MSRAINRARFKTSDLVLATEHHWSWFCGTCRTERFFGPSEKEPGRAPACAECGEFMMPSHPDRVPS